MLTETHILVPLVNCCFRDSTLKIGPVKVNYTSGSGSRRKGQAVWSTQSALVEEPSSHIHSCRRFLAGPEYNANKPCYCSLST